MKLPWQLGYALIGASLAADCLLLACAARDEQQTLNAQRSTLNAEVRKFPINHQLSTLNFPDVTETPAIGCHPGIVWSEVMDRRPFLLRVLASLRPWGEAASSHARLRISEEKAELAGGWHDNERVDRRHFLPQTYAVGFGGGANF